MAAFASYVVLYPRKKGQKHNILSHAEWAVAAVRGYYQAINGMVPGKDVLIDFSDYMKGILKGPGKPYSYVP